MDHRGLVFHAIRKAARPHPYMEREDFEGIALRGLVKASQTWNPKVSRFQTHAIHVMAGEIMHEMRDRSEVPGWLYEACGKMGKAIERLSRRGIFEPTDAQIAAEIGPLKLSGKDEPRPVSAEMVANWRKWNPQPAVSLDTGMGDDTALDMEKCRALIDPGIGRDMDAAIVLRETLKVLSPRQQVILNLRYWKGWSQTEIARQSGFSCNYISYLEKKALKRLRNLLARTFNDGLHPEVAIPIHTRRQSAGQAMAPSRWKQDPDDPILALVA